MLAAPVSYVAFVCSWPSEDESCLARRHRRSSRTKSGWLASRQASKLVVTYRLSTMKIGFQPIAVLPVLCWFYGACPARFVCVLPSCACLCLAQPGQAKPSPSSSPSTWDGLLSRFFACLPLALSSCFPKPLDAVYRFPALVVIMVVVVDACCQRLLGDLCDTLKSPFVIA